MPEPITSLVDRALDGYVALAATGEKVEDEWQYVTDLAAAWQARLRTVAAGLADRNADDALVAAVQQALDEIARISDPHRAIDWLSTFPQVILLALGEEDRPPTGPAG